MRHIFTLLIFLGFPILFIYSQSDSLSIQSNDKGTANSQGGANDFIKHLNSQPLNKQYIAPVFAGEQYADYGESKHDKGLTFLDEMSGNNLQEMRNQAEKKEQKKIILNIIIGITVLGLIIFLVRRSNNSKLDKDENE